MRARAVIPSLLGLALVGCGYTGGGSGSNTLEVIAEVTHYANSDRTHLEVRVNDDTGHALADAAVAFTDDQEGETIPLIFDGRHEYEADVDGYRRRLRLAVVQGDSHLDGTIEGPGTHEIVKPANARSRAVSKNLLVVWATQDGVRAEQTIVRLNQSNFSTVLTDDPGSYEIPQSFLRIGSGQVAVSRRNSVVLEGGIGASSLTSGYLVENDLTIEDR